MSCNIILTDAGSLRATQFNSKECYDISSIKFYVPAYKAEHSQVFIVMRTPNNLYEIVELAKAKVPSSGGQTLYKLPINQALRINNEQVELSMLLIDLESGEHSRSYSIKISISTENYTLARQVYIAQQVNQKIQDLYIKILALTDENKELYEKMREGDK